MTQPPCDYAPPEPVENPDADRDHALRFWVSFATSGWTAAGALTIVLLIIWGVIP